MVCGGGAVERSLGPSVGHRPNVPEVLLYGCSVVPNFCDVLWAVPLVYSVGCVLWDHLQVIRAASDLGCSVWVVLWVNPL